MRFDNWTEFLEHQRQQAVMLRITERVMINRAHGPVYPADQIFRFTDTPLRSVKVVILGQDPYHGPGQADGLALILGQRENAGC